MIKPKVRNSLKKKKSKSQIGKRSRVKGQEYERLLVKEFKEKLGYTNCRTSRMSSYLLDACRVDLDVPDLNVQAKNVRSALKYADIFDEIQTELGRLIPARRDLPTLIFHKRIRRELVIMEKHTFYQLYSEYLKLKNAVSSKSAVSGEPT